MNEKIQKLINLAKQKMAGSMDHCHDLSHVNRVVNFSEQISREFNLSEKQKQALLIAAWWHDVGRTIKKNPSYIWMSFLDDMISAFLLWKTSLGAFSSGGVTGLSSRIILCKSLGTGAFFTKFLLWRDNRILVNILTDADRLDQFNLERHKEFFYLVENSRRYRLSYRIMNRWFFYFRQIKLKTAAAKEMIKQIMRTFLNWIKSVAVFNWHVRQFGYIWTQKNLRRVEKAIFRIQCAA
ncbi:MAG: HD domain-containing protein [Patescibacteria group bacterium]